MADTKLLSSGSFAAGTPKVSNSGGNSSGPTGSSRSYPKGGKPSMDAGKMNPQKVKGSTYGLGCG